MITEISCFLYFPDGNWPPCWIFKNIKFYMVGKIEAHHHARLSRNWSINSRDIAIFFQFSKWPLPPSWIFKLWNFIGRQYLDGPDAALYQISSKSVGLLQRYWDLSNFQDGCHYLGFLKLQNFIGYSGTEGRVASASQISAISINWLQRY